LISEKKRKIENDKIDKEIAEQEQFSASEHSENKFSKSQMHVI